MKLSQMAPPNCKEAGKHDLSRCLEEESMDFDKASAFSGIVGLSDVIAIERMAFNISIKK